MAEENDEKQVENTETVVKVKKSRSGLWFGIFVLILIIALAGVGYFLLDQFREKQEQLGGEISKEDVQIAELRTQITGYQTQIAAIQKKLTSLDADIAGKDSHIDNRLNQYADLHNSKLETTQQRLSIAIERIQRQLGKTRGDWLIADAEYLISVANRRLHLMSDTKTTLEALKAADQRLRESGDAAAFKVRGQLAKEIAAIEKVKLPDIVGLYSKIQTLEDSVPNLTLLLPFSGKGLTKKEEHAVQEAEQEMQEGMLGSALDSLGELVTIRHTDRPIKTVLTEEEAVFIQEQLKVKLEMVKIALVQRNDPLYKKSLADARQWLKSHFMDDKKTKNFEDGLNKLDAISLRSQLPDISQSLKMLRDITKLRIETDKALQDQQPAEQ